MTTGRTRLPAGGGSGATAVGSANPAWGAAGGGSKRPRGGGGGGDASMPNTDDDDSDGELELSRLSPEEQERVLTARLAGGGAGASDKDARRLKRLLRNRVSAQQARERKKQYVSSLEDQIREQQAHIGLLEKRLEDVESQNEALRNIIMTMRGFSDNPPAGGAAAAAGAAGGPTGRPPGAAAARPPTQARGRAAAAPHIQPQPAPQPQSPRGFRAGPGLLSGAALGGSAGCGGAQQQPQQPDQVVPELPPGQPDLDAPHGQEMQQEEGQAQQRQAPENRHSAPQRPPADAAPQYPAAPPGGGDGSGSSPSVGFAAVPSIPGLGAAAPRPALLTHGSDALRYPTPVLGQLPPDVLAGMEPGGMSYNQGFGAEDDDVPPDIEGESGPERWMLVGA
ncbi:hypothetical protein PLESTF_000444300 [Pleodorina starrii]|nr:hypothetical protein PLESTM_000074900 [Pleodorina starrii]GLC66563.1 hypothetical protein PLESTF_000444300 [Pleodorina starrii]